MAMRNIFLGLALSLFVAGCSYNQPTYVPTTDPIESFQEQIQGFDQSLTIESELRTILDQDNTPTSDYVYPMENYVTLRTKKVFGQFIAPNSGDRFSGYHTGDDIEVVDVTAEVPFYALADATVLRKETVGGYGGVLIVEFVDNGTTYQALYGHVDLASISAAVGDVVVRGTRLGVLGDDLSSETDGERKHLHFALYPSTGTVLYAGYTSNDADLQQWVNPSDFLREASASQPVAVE